MGWSCNITCDKNILESDIQDILEDMLDNMGKSYSDIIVDGKMEVNKQKWGWSAKADVWNPEDNKISFSGSCGLSNDLIKPFKREFRKLLKLKGYKVKTRMSY